MVRKTTSSKRPRSYHGLQRGIPSLRLPRIDTWQNEYPEREYTIHMEVPEFTCVCPKTGLPDFAVITIDYVPAKKCIELKSFKSYIVAYRDIGIFHEHAVNKVLDDFVAACAPRRARVTGDFNMRGGIHTVVSAEYQSE